MPSFELPALFVDAVASVAAASTGSGRPVLVLSLIHISEPTRPTT